MEITCPYCDTHLDSVDTLHQAYNRAPMYTHKCIRYCPVCLHKYAKTIYQWHSQKVLSCEECGMVYADSAPVNYSDESLYSDPSYYGSRPQDIIHYKMIAERIRLYVSKNAAILDIGCATGGLLTELRNIGCGNLEGFDLSLKAAAVCRDKGFIATSSLPYDKKYDCIILSHVLEHVRDTHALLHEVRRILSSTGLLYIEVPDAKRYSQMQTITESFNLEHINHFTANSLYELLVRTGFTTLRYGDASFPHGKGEYPATWILCKKRYRDSSYMDSYIKNLISNSDKVLSQIPSGKIALWGVGQLAHRILYDNVKVIAATDSNTAYHGREMFGVTVVPPTEFHPDPKIPILICTQLHKDEIKQRISELGLTNPCIEIS